MARLQLSNPTTPTVRRRPRWRVYVRKLWTDDWQSVPYLEPLTATNAAAPTMPSARFLWRAGKIKREDADAFAVVDITGLNDWFVRIDVLGQGGAADEPIWYGVFGDDATAHAGTDRGPTADQELTAYGLEHLLDRVTLTTSSVLDAGNSLRVIGHALPFNEDYVAGFTEIGNRSAAKQTFIGGPSYYVFGNDRAVWSGRDIVDYLLGAFDPGGLGWRIDNAPTSPLDALAPPRLKVEGQTVWQVLNELVDRKRGLGYRVRVVKQRNANERVFLDVFTQVDAKVTVGSKTLPANGRLVGTRGVVDTDRLGHLVKSVEVATDSNAQYGTIYVTGERVVSCFTVGFADGTLQAGWTNAEETKYRAAVPGTGREKDQERGTDKFRHVFTRYTIPAAWNWRAGDGEGGSKQVAAPKLDDQGAVDTLGGVLLPGKVQPADVRNWGHRLLRTLPLLKAIDASTGEPEYREPAVFVKDTRGRVHAGYAYVDSAAVAGDVGGSVRVLDKDFGVEVRFHPNHVLALNHWTIAGEPTEKQPTLDYRTLVATVAARTDQRLLVRVTVPGFDPARVLWINVPDAEFWYLVPGTVTDVDNGNLKKSTARDAIVRDDGPRLREVAALAKAWYGKRRGNLRLVLRDVTPGFAVGNFVRAVEDRYHTRPVNATVSSVTFDFGRELSMSVQTNYAELDVTAGGVQKHTLK